MTGPEVAPNPFERLTAPFELHELEWRVLRSGVKGDKVWAIVIPYVSARAIHSRLDQVLGPANWRCEYHEWTAGKPGVLCGLSLRVGVPGWEDGWVTKWDGSEQSKESGGDDAPSMAVKGGFSGALKRAAAVWGIGRYLYELEDLFADVKPDGQFRGVAKRDRNDKEGVKYRWDPPPLYRPSSNGRAAAARQAPPAAQAAPATPANAPVPPEERPYTIAGVTRTVGETGTDELVALRVWCEKKNTSAALGLIPAIDAVLEKRDRTEKVEAGVASGDDLPF